MNRISRIFSGGRVPHSFLITGEDSAEKEAFAKTLARALLCESDVPPCGVCSACRKESHPDLTVITDGLDTERARALISDSFILPNDAKRKVYLILDANTLSAYVQNVFLKALEEPPRHACFILTATHTSELIPTVVSRCALIKLSGGGHDLAYVEEAAAILTPLSQKDELGVLRAVTALEKCDRADLREILEACRTLLRDSALHPLPPLSETTPQFRFTHAEFVSCADAIETARDGIERNLGVAIILGALCARLIRAMNAEEEQ